MRVLTRSIFLFIAMTIMPAIASPLDDARKAGQVMEMPNGYVMAQGQVPSNVNTLVTDINKRRRDAYEKIARENGISAKQVAAESYKQRHGK
ncbi:MAG: DUF1318 domain-containing protein [Pseudomonadales bacterium]|jgi:uncharacterized protein YdbL (DUF1318 family)